MFQKFDLKNEVHRLLLEKFMQDDNLAEDDLGEDSDGKLIKYLCCHISVFQWFEMLFYINLQHMVSPSVDFDSRLVQ